MKTTLPTALRTTAAGQEAEKILRSCVHCGLCLATCPTYQLLGDELDSPRGRIYLIKEMLEGSPVTDSTRLHLDRCLTCHACETTCPSGVQYGRLLDIGRAAVVERAPRGLVDESLRAVLRAVLPREALFALLLKLGRLVRPVLPTALSGRIPATRAPPEWPAARHARRMVVLRGCVQPALAPASNAALARVLDAVGISVIEAPAAGCCGAVVHHLDDPDGARHYMRRNIDAWWPLLEEGAEAIVMTASGCGAMVRDYGQLLRDDPAYAERAERISALTRDALEVVAVEREKLKALFPAARRARVAFQSPCTLQHWQQIRGVAELLLRDAGYELTPVPDSHLCCGSAGSYSLLQPTLARELARRKLTALHTGEPVIIATANVGCQTHLQSATTTPVRHWVELLDEALPTVSGRGAG